MFSFISKLTKKQLLFIAVILSFIPFPTQAVPEWKIRIVDEQDQPIGNVRVLQYWDNYTFWGYNNRTENAVSNENGYATFAPKYIWVSPISRIIFPPIAFLSQLAHGSAGTHSNIRIVDDNYSTAFSSSWDDGEIIYFHFPETLPDKLVTRRISTKPEASNENTEIQKSKPVGNLKID